MSLLTSAPWRRAPLLLWRSPAVLAAVIGAGLVLGAAAAASPLFLSSAGGAAQARQIGERCQYTVRSVARAPVGGVLPNRDPDSVGLQTRRDKAVRSASARVPGLLPPLLTMSSTVPVAVGVKG